MYALYVVKHGIYRPFKVLISSYVQKRKDFSGKLKIYQLNDPLFQELRQLNVLSANNDKMHSFQTSVGGRFLHERV